jgi:hypothetical protein
MMKTLLMALFLFSLSAAGLTQNNPNRKNTAPFGSPVNATSDQSGSSTGSVSDGAIGPNEKEAKEARKRAKTMGGAPNMGAGMGTGTGAGSTVGQDVGADRED